MIQSKNDAILNSLPKTVLENLFRLKEIETALGHLPAEELNLKEVSARVELAASKAQSGKYSMMEKQTELVFGDICDELHSLGKSFEEIANVINAVVKYEGGPKYCNAKEVSEALGHFPT
jgi:phage terminase Nu1 subunit (DNA packaging protein)